MNEDDLNNVIRNAVTGDRTSQKKIFDLYSTKMMTVCLRYTKSQADADDVLQNGFVRVFSKLDQFRFEGSFEGWVRRIIVHSALNFLKNKKRFVPLETDKMITLPKEVEDDTKAQKILEVIKSLPDGYKSVFNMYLFEGFDHKEIGDILGITASTSRSQLTKARRLLMDKLKKQNLV